MVGGGPVVQLAVVVASVVGLWVGARLLVAAAVQLARRAGLSDLTVGLTVVAALWTGRELSRLEGGLLAGSELLRWTLGLLGIVG